MEENQMTKQRLASYVSLKLEIKNRLERLARLKNEAELPAARESDGSQHTGGAGDRMEKAVIRYMEYEQHITAKIEENRAEMMEIEAAIDALPDPMEREVLRLRYIDNEYFRLMPWKYVALRLFGDNDDKHLLATYRLHGRALQHVLKK